jgi:hypothetical protein
LIIVGDGRLQPDKGKSEQQNFIFAERIFQNPCTERKESDELFFEGTAIL